MSLDFNALATKVSHLVMKINSYFRSPVDILYVYGGGTVYTDATITAALTAIGSTMASIKLAPGTWTISNNITIPANIYIDISTATLSIASGKTFTNNGLMDETLNQKFNGAGSVVLGKVKKIYPQWFGVIGDNATDNSAAYVKMLAINPKSVYFSSGTYLGTLAITNPIRLLGSGRGSCTLKNNSASTELIKLSGSASFSDIENFTLDNNNVPANTLRLQSVTYVTGKKLVIKNHGNSSTLGKFGVSLGSSTLSSFSDIDFYDISQNYGGHLYIDTSYYSVFRKISAGMGCQGANEYPIELDTAEGVNFHGLSCDAGVKGVIKIYRSQNVGIYNFTTEINDQINHTGQAGLIHFSDCKNVSLYNSYIAWHTLVGTSCPFIYSGDGRGVNLIGGRWIRSINASTPPIVHLEDNDNVVIENITVNNRTTFGGVVGLDFTFLDNNVNNYNSPTTNLTLKNIHSDLLPTGTAGTPTYIIEYVTGLVIENVDGVIASVGNAVGKNYVPSFNIRANSGIANVTGDGTVYTVVFDSELFDAQNNFASNTFTAPITGYYQIAWNITLTGVSTSHTLGELNLVTSPRSYRSAANYGAMQTSGELTLTGSLLVPLSYGETAYITIAVTGGAKEVDVATNSWFTGTLVN